MKVRPLHVVAVALGVLSELAFLVIVAPPVACRERGSGDVLFYDRGVVSFTKPDYSGYGSPSAGMYGSFVDFVSLLGFNGRVVHDIPDSLDGVYALVLTNLEDELPPEVKDRIWGFVAGGGNLFLLGEHTFIRNGRNSLNLLLEPAAIRFRNDSAKNLVQGWFEAYDVRLVQSFACLDNDAQNSLSLLVGASLDIRPPAEPLILGRYGFSDLGTAVEDPKQGHFGDYRFTRNERLGDLVLVAGQPYGKGRVVVFADTTSFFNSNTTTSWRLIQAVFTYFRSEPLLGAVRPGVMLPAAVLFLGLGLLALRHVDRRASVSLALGVALAYALVWPSALNLVPFVAAEARARLALIDYSHNPGVSKHGGMDSGLYGLKVNLLRHGLLPVTRDVWDPALLQSANCLFLLAPQKRFGPSEIALVRAFVEAGGSVVVTCGREHREGAQDLLAAFDLEVLNVPMGRSFDKDALGGPVSFYSAWPIAVRAADAEVITRSGDQPLIVAVRWGKGRLVLIGDSGFLLNKNLESDGTHDINNIHFVRRLLDYLKAGVAP